MSSNRSNHRAARRRWTWSLWPLAAVLAVAVGCSRADEASDESGPAVENEAAAAQRPEPRATDARDASRALRIGRQPPRVGDTVREESTFEMRVLVQHVIDDEGGPSFERHSLDRTRKHTTVLAVDDGGAITEAEVAYEARSSSLDQDGQTHTADSPLVGRRYRIVAAATAPPGDDDAPGDDVGPVVEYADQADDIEGVDEADDPTEGDDTGDQATGDHVDDEPTDDAPEASALTPAARWLGAARASLVSAVAVSGISEFAERIDEAALVRVPPADEVAEVRGDNRGLGQPDALREMLPSNALEPGTPTAMNHEHVARLFALGTSEAEVEVATLQLERVVERDGRQLAELVADLTVRVDDGEAMSMRLVLSGALVVQVETGWIESMTLDGEVETAGRIDRGESTTRMTGSGTVSMRYEASYSTASP